MLSPSNAGPQFGIQYGLRSSASCFDHPLHFLAEPVFPARTKILPITMRSGLNKSINIAIPAPPAYGALFMQYGPAALLRRRLPHAEQAVPRGQLPAPILIWGQLVKPASRAESLPANLPSHTLPGPESIMRICPQFSRHTACTLIKPAIENQPSAKPRSEGDKYHILCVLFPAPYFHSASAQALASFLQECRHSPGDLTARAVIGT